METKKSFLGLLKTTKEIFGHVERKRKKQFSFLLVLTLIGAFAEILSLSSIIPFIAALVNPQDVLEFEVIAYFANILGITESSDLIIFITIVFISAAILAGITRLILLWFSIRLANLTGADISIKIFNITLYQPYQVHVSRNTSEVISNITMKVNMAIVVLTSMVTAISSFVLFSVIIATLFIIDPLICMITFFVFGVSYIFIGFASKSILKSNSIKLANSQDAVMRTLQEGMGAIREILLENIQSLYKDNYSTAIRSLKKSTGDNAFINQYPRYVLEAIGIIVIACIAAYYSSGESNSINNILPVLGALAFGAQRLLPLLQQFYGNWAYVIGSQAQLEDVIKMLNQKMPLTDIERAENIKFKNSIKIDNIGFKYQGTNEEILKDINLEIAKGSRIGISGATGSGKSTLMDIILGLLKPSSGRLCVDGIELSENNIVSWQENIAHVPQNIFLLDASIEKNIAFSEKDENIDRDLVRRCAIQAQLENFIENTPEKYETMVGERGAKLSGGQMQRIGIARALYKKADVLVFDEATSALDYNTEKEVMESIENLSNELTIFIVAHRLSTIEFCDNVIHLENKSFNIK